jgi:uncharacterized protein (DUF1501 family)
MQLKEKRYMSKLLAVVLFTITSLAAQVPVCMAVSEDDARILLGATAKRTKDPSGCGWEDSGHKKELIVARIGVAAMFEGAHADSVQKGPTKDENGLGGTAFSTIPSAHNGTQASIYLVKGPAVLVVKIEGFEPGDAAQYLPQMRDLVRKLVPKL